MDSQLLTLSKIFTERLFRIPDYQRGYAWGEKQLRDFWSDIEQLESPHSHYTGVLTLERVPENIHMTWEDDRWVISSKNYEPFFVVDGQQRLTTAIILLQVILEQTDDENKLNYTDKNDIKRKFIFDSKDGLISRPYIFGYEKDNPSYNYLKSKIFGEWVSEKVEETVYTQNLSAAKRFFEEKVGNFTHADIENLYRKVTQSLLFNIFTISEEVDVCVAFETMNNRGKPLSHLELLKNRLIYLSLKFNAPDYERSRLRKAINDCWRTLYHNLGRNKDKPLDDDLFLETHSTVYFNDYFLNVGTRLAGLRRRRQLRINYVDSLLEEVFISRNVTNPPDEIQAITLGSIYGYVSSLQECIEIWYSMFNPLDSELDHDIKFWLDKLNRLGMDDNLPIILVILKLNKDSKKSVNFLRALERCIFIRKISERYVGHFIYFGRTVFEDIANDISGGKLTIEKATAHITENIDHFLSQDIHIADILPSFRDAKGAYGWVAIKYFLFEYNLHLQEKSKTHREKIFWPEYVENSDDYISVEHIYPQKARSEYWTQRFSYLNAKQRALLRNSIGNLLPLSKPKNSSLSNKPFPDKVEGSQPNAIGYRYGSYAENEIAALAEWTPDTILMRGLSLLKFMEKRWKIDLGDDDNKMKLLGLGFIKNASRRSLINPKVAS